MDYSQFTEKQLKKRIKEARIQMDILNQQETDMMMELYDRKTMNIGFSLPKFQKHIKKFINSNL
jgi:hypothetical protein